MNYFIRGDDGNFLNDKTDKAVWLKWMELRANRDVDALESPIGYIPKYEDLREIFREILGKDYGKEDYQAQFTIRIPELLSKIARIEEIYREIPGTPRELFEELDAERERLKDARNLYGDRISPFDLGSI